jgi:hypothetical protein
MPFQVNSEQHVLHHILNVVPRHPDAGKAAPDDASQGARKIGKELAVGRFIARNRGAHQSRPFRVSSLPVQNHAF